MKYLVYLDSRNAPGFRSSNCIFNLNQPIVNASRVRVVSFVFANNLYNITPQNNALVFDTFTLVIPVGHYTQTQLLAYINAQCAANAAFQAAHPTNPCVWEDDIDKSILIWNIGDQSLRPTSLFLMEANPTVFGYNHVFGTGIFLGSPWAIALNSPTLQGTTRFVNAVPNQISAPFYVQHIQSANGQIESSDASINMQYAVPLSHANMQQLHVILSDPYLNRELTEIGAWSCILEVTVE